MSGDKNRRSKEQVKTLTVIDVCMKKNLYMYITHVKQCVVNNITFTVYIVSEQNTGIILKIIKYILWSCIFIFTVY